MNRFFTALLAGFVLMLTAGLAVAAGQKSMPPAQAFIDRIAGDVLKIVQDEAIDAECKTLKLQKLFADTVDIDWMGKFVLGRHYRTAEDEQKIAYLNAYKPFIIQNYVTRLTKYTGQTYEITGTKQGADGDNLVSMKLLDPNGPPVLVDYRVRDEKAEGLKVIDIIVEGVSLITTQRSEFNSVVTNKGLDFLIQALEKKAAATK